MAMYALGNPPRTGSEVFNALEGAVGGDEFTLEEAVAIVSNEMEVSLDDASSSVRRLVQAGCIEEV